LRHVIAFHPLFCCISGPLMRGLCRCPFFISGTETLMIKKFQLTSFYPRCTEIVLKDPIPVLAESFEDAEAILNQRIESGEINLYDLPIRDVVFSLAGTPPEVLGIELLTAEDEPSTLRLSNFEDVPWFCEPALD
jgi:hypothetical protein